MPEEEARAEIVNLLNEHNQYAVIWWGHCGLRTRADAKEN